MDYPYHIKHVLESFTNFVDAWELVLQHIPVEKAGLNLVEGGERSNHSNLVDSPRLKQDLSQEPNKKAEPDAVEQIVNKQFRTPCNQVFIAESQDYKAKNEAILHTGQKRDVEQDSHSQKICKVLEALTQLEK